ncbi:MAG: metal-dependent transcriptional regulator [Treponema sp.]|nr:metal-dependent transcriptional regulator [Treponema sp.]
MNGIYESGEDYLEAILCLKEENGAARSVDVARKLNVSKPSVSRAMSILEEKGYVYVSKIGSLELTEQGKELAVEIYDRHVLLTKFLQKITGVGEEQAEANACKIEHDIDDDIKRGIEKWMKENG